MASHKPRAQRRDRMQSRTLRKPHAPQSPREVRCSHKSPFQKDLVQLQWV